MPNYDDSFWDNNDWIVFRSSLKVNLTSTIIVSCTCLALFSIVFTYLCWSETLWIKRFFRINHTLLIPPKKRGACLSARADGVNGASHPSARASDVRNERNAATATAVDPTGWCGLSLPAHSALFSLPSFRDWISVEEELPRASIPVLPSSSSAPSSPSSSPYSANTRGGVSGARSHVTSEGSLEPGAPLDCSPTSYSAASATSERKGGPSGAPRGERGSRRHRGSEAPGEITSLARQGSTLGDLPVELEGGFSRDYVDPQSVLYIFTLKYFASVMFLGGLFVVWIIVLAVHARAEKGRFFDEAASRNETCAPGSKGCTPQNTTDLKYEAAFEITVQDIPPKSWMWWIVALLNCAFCAVFTLLTVYFVRAVGRYVDVVMARQIQHAPGYRLVCIRSGNRKQMTSVESFRRRFLHEAVYFESGSNSPRWHSWLERMYPDYIWRWIRNRGCMLDRSNTILWEPSKVKRVVITQRPPSGMLTTMRRERRRVRRFQEAVVVAREEQRKAARRAPSPAEAASHPPPPAGGEKGEEGDLTCIEVVPTEASRESKKEEPKESGCLRVGRRIGQALKRGARACTKPCRARKAHVKYHEDRIRSTALELNRYIVEAPMQEADFAGFVEFEDSRSALEFVNLFRARFGSFTSGAVVSIAGPHQGILMGNLQIWRVSAILRRILMMFFFLLLVTCYTIPIAIISSLENIAYILGYHDEFVRIYTASMPNWLIQVINSYLPVVVLALFNILLPAIIRFIVGTMKLLNQREFEAKCLHLQYLFMVLSGVVFQSALQGGLKEIALVVTTDTKNFAKTFFLDCVVPKSNVYFYAKVLYSLGLSIWIDAIDPLPFLRALLLRGYAKTQGAYNAIFARRKPDYVDWYSFDMTTLAIGLLFHMAVPMLVPAVLLYFILRYLLQRARLFDQHRAEVPVERDCTNFGITAWVIRRTMLLYILSEIGGLVVLYVNAHTGGLVLFCLTLSVSVGLTIYVVFATRNWTISLRRIHELSKARSDATELDGHAERLSSVEISTKQVRELKSRAGSPQSEPPQTPVAKGNDKEEDEAREFMGNLSIVWDRPSTEGAEKIRHEGAVSMDSYATQNEPTSQIMNSGVGEVCPECEIQLRKRLSRGHACTSRYRKSCLYLPLHLRLRIIDVEAEIEKMYVAKYDVVQYWNKPDPVAERPASV
ncbi:unnamed protein product, partial [Phytomonas sp. EM1]